MADGYSNEQWWAYAQEAEAWRVEHPQPIEAAFIGDSRPRESVCWYDAVAFCHWLSDKTGLTITLPTVQQWQRAAQGDDQRRFPWGDDLDTNLGNTLESKIRKTSSVTLYPQGAGPFGTFDMAGNVWEWCLNRCDGKPMLLTDKAARALRGGSYNCSLTLSGVTFEVNLNPRFYYATIGFRVMAQV
jgi:formylglycine-generating enzyme required for sulfatase activity